LAETVSFQPQGKKLQFPGVESYQPSTFAWKVHFLCNTYHFKHLSKYTEPT